MECRILDRLPQEVAGWGESLIEVLRAEIAERGQLTEFGQRRTMKWNDEIARSMKGAGTPLLPVRACITTKPGLRKDAVGHYMVGDFQLAVCWCIHNSWASPAYALIAGIVTWFAVTAMDSSQVPET